MISLRDFKIVVVRNIKGRWLFLKIQANCGVIFTIYFRARTDGAPRLTPGQRARFLLCFTTYQILRILQMVFSLKVLMIMHFYKRKPEQRTGKRFFWKVEKQYFHCFLGRYKQFFFVSYDPWRPRSLGLPPRGANWACSQHPLTAWRSYKRAKQTAKIVKKIFSVWKLSRP